MLESLSIPSQDVLESLTISLQDVPSMIIRQEPSQRGYVYGPLTHSQVSVYSRGTKSTWLCLWDTHLYLSQHHILGEPSQHGYVYGILTLGQVSMAFSRNQASMVMSWLSHHGTYCSLHQRGHLDIKSI